MKLLFFLSLFSSLLLIILHIAVGFFLPLLGRGGFRKRKAGFLQTKKTLVCGKKKLGERNFKKLAKSLGEMILEKKKNLGKHVSFTISFL